MNIIILLRHSGVWQSKVSYERYKSDGIVVGDNVSYSNLKTIIAVELTIDESVKNIEIQYIIQVKENQLYKDKATLFDVMDKYKVDNGFNFKVKRSDSKSYVLICYSDDCCWRMKASCWKKSNIFKVSYFNSEHSCALRGRIFSKVHATKAFFCRFVVVVDGAHLDGPYKGTFVSASTLDGAGCILPLAYGVIDTKNDSS
ncbi:uncharacterized protein LOC129870240 [Solanum dulcamara]|uniref:uncharacterized protein LOC129870240 n=1 Tax=Solanum dulcamara TaxID=45834 RepID=UPI002485ACF1|nr:uncharacterized protein LOC129870240 [Solanum dulcamara]